MCVYSLILKAGTSTVSRSSAGSEFQPLIKINFLKAARNEMSCRLGIVQHDNTQLILDTPTSLADAEPVSLDPTGWRQELTAQLRFGHAAMAWACGRPASTELL